MCLVVVALVLIDAKKVEAQNERTNIAIVAGGRVTDGLTLARGKSVELSVALDGHIGAAIGGSVMWTAVPADVIDVRNYGGGRVTVTALRDIFDSSQAREPRASLSACVGSACTSISIVCVLSVEGSWKVHITVKQLPITQDRNFPFTQDGRKFEYRKVGLRLDGVTMRMTNGAGLLTRLDGTFTGRDTVHGVWSTTDGFSGTWTGVRGP